MLRVADERSRHWVARLGAARCYRAVKCSSCLEGEQRTFNVKERERADHTGSPLRVTIVGAAVADSGTARASSRLL